MKQLYLTFVLPPIIFSVIIWSIFTAYAGFGLWNIIILCVIAAWLFLSIRIVKQLNQLRNSLLDLEKSSLETTNIKGNGIFDELNQTVETIFKRIRNQEDEIQREKLRRLRSVIDGQDQERQRLSRELHDGIGQSLIAIKLQLENAETQNYSMMRAGVDAAKNMIDTTIEDVRNVCNALIPAALNEFGIVSTLRALSSELGALAGFKAVFENEGSLDRMSKKSQVYLYRIAQEALNNIAKHARASHVNMKLKRNENIVTLEVTDNGKGFIFDPVCFAQRNGLQNMRERTQLLQGEFSINSEPGKGTTIIVSIPYHTSNGKDQTHIG